MKIILEQDELDIIANAASANNVDVEQLYDKYEGTIASNFEQDIDDAASDLHDELSERLNELREKERVCGLDRDEICELEELEETL